MPHASAVWYANATPNHFQPPNSWRIAIATTTQGMYRSTKIMNESAVRGVNAPWIAALSGVWSSFSSEDSAESPTFETTLPTDALAAFPNDPAMSLRSSTSVGGVSSFEGFGA